LKKRILRDFTVVASLDRVRIDDQQTYNSLKAFSEEYIPEMLPKLEHYPVDKIATIWPLLVFIMLKTKFNPC